MFLGVGGVAVGVLAYLSWHIYGCSLFLDSPGGGGGAADAGYGY